MNSLGLSDEGIEFLVAFVSIIFLSGWGAILVTMMLIGFCILVLALMGFALEFKMLRATK